MSKCKSSDIQGLEPHFLMHGNVIVVRNASLWAFLLSLSGLFSVVKAAQGTTPNIEQIIKSPHLFLYRLLFLLRNKNK
ncbi:hypothetical protein CEXT_379261 [Caerostris extrusa]|uniref:Uncharacterized protein n=1 Tax=Caerostris extrusa TaxID=172846 RepID=A0AAV4PX80_CAEEX|nr:hypothetical protein CEXT_379261 [Caerostris extrusa]